VILVPARSILKPREEGLELACSACGSFGYLTLGGMTWGSTCAGG
jgi:hypothetical protein